MDVLLNILDEKSLQSLSFSQKTWCETREDMKKKTTFCSDKKLRLDFIYQSAAQIIHASMQRASLFDEAKSFDKSFFCSFC